MFDKVADNALKVKSCDGFNPGDVVELFDGKASAYAVIKSSQDNIIVFETPVTADVVDKNLRPVKYIRTAEIKVTVKYEETAEEYDCVSFNPEASNYIVSRMQKSDLVKVACGAASAPAVKAAAPVKGKDGKEEPAPAPVAAGVQTPFTSLGGNGGMLLVSLAGGSDGNIAGVTAAEYIGADNGPAAAPASRPSWRTPWSPSWPCRRDRRRRAAVPGGPLRKPQVPLCGAGYAPERHQGG